MQSSRKQPSRRLEKRENSRRWLLIPALCAAVILAVVLIVELSGSPRCCRTAPTPLPFPMTSPRLRTPNRSRTQSLYRSF